MSPVSAVDLVREHQHLGSRARGEAFAEATSVDGVASGVEREERLVDE